MNDRRKILLALAACLPLWATGGLWPAPARATSMKRERLVPLVGQIVASQGSLLKLAAETGTARYVVLRTPHTTYWERTTLATDADLVVGVHVQVWATRRADGVYAAAKFYFKVTHFSGTIGAIGPRSIAVAHAQLLGRDRGMLRVTHGAGTAVWQDNTLVSRRQLFPGMSVGIVGYLHRDGTVDARIIRIYPSYLTGTIVARDALAVVVRDGTGRREPLYLAADTTILREAHALGAADLAVGDSIWAHAYPQADGSYRAQDIHLVSQPFAGVLVSTGQTLILVNAAHRRYVLQPLAGIVVSYRHAHPVPLARLRSGSKVTGRAYQAGGHTLLVVSLVAWIIPSSPPPKASR